MAYIVASHADYIPVYVIDDDVADVDALALYDINGDGNMDFVSADSTPGAQVVYWYQMNGGVRVARHVIDNVAAHFSSSDVEGAAVLELAGKLLVVMSGQDAGVLTIHTPTTPGQPEGPWTYASLLTGKTWMQGLFAYDIDDDGELELVYCFEGSVLLTGGVCYLDFDGADPMVAADWTEYTMADHEGAFWPVRDFHDIAGNGRGDLVFAARNSGRNPNAEPGIYWLEKPVNPTATWTKHTIDARVADWTKVETANLYGDGHSKDVVAADILNIYDIAMYRFNDSYALTTNVPLAGGTETWNIRRIPPENGCGVNGRDALLIVHNDSYMYVYQWIDGAWLATAFDEYPTMSHPMDGPIEWYDLDDDGILEAIIPDSTDSPEIGDKLFWAKIGSGVPYWEPSQPTPSGEELPLIELKASELGWPEDMELPYLPDFSGNNHHLLASGANQPTMVTDATTGLPMLYFDGTNVLTNTTFVMDLRAFTFFYIGRQTGAGTNQGLFVITPSSGDDGNQTTSFTFRTGATDGQRPTVLASTPSTISLTGADDDLVELAIWCIRKAQGGDVQLYKGGTLLSTDSSYTEMAAASGGGIILGGRYASGAVSATNRLIGHFLHFLAYVYLDDDDVNEVGNALERHWDGVVEWEDI